MNLPRVPLLSIDEAKEAAAEVGIVEVKAGLSMYRVLLRQPQLAKRVSDMMETLSTQSEFDTRLRELIIMRIGWSNGGVYEWSLHWLLAQQFGVEERDLLAVRDWEAHDHWSAVDRAILRATDETLASGAISQTTWDECAKHFPTDRERLELVAIIGNWKMISELLKNLEVPLENGIAAWPPDGVPPSAKHAGVAS
ncbi:MAG: carboxymuconolactone decarboxylase family protein [Myxococcota bacterium]